MAKTLGEYLKSLGISGWLLMGLNLFTALGAFELYTEISVLQNIPTWGWIVLLGVGLIVMPFRAFHKVRTQRDELHNQLYDIKNALPNVTFDSVSSEPYQISVTDAGLLANQGVLPVTYPKSPSYQWAYYTRLAFRNVVVSPSGDGSTAEGTSAKIEVLAREDNSIVDTWDGRWAKTNAPYSYENIIQKNRRDIPANEKDILDIGFRIKGELEFQGHDNRHNSYAQPLRRRINPASYYLRVILRATNMGIKEFWFTLVIPNEPQSDDVNQVQIEIIERPAIRKAGSQT